MMSSAYAVAAKHLTIDVQQTQTCETWIQVEMIKICVRQSATIMIFLVVICVSSRGSASPYSLNEITAAYSNIVFTTHASSLIAKHDKSARLNKFSFPLRISLSATNADERKKWRIILSRHMRTLSRLSGKPMTFANKDTATVAFRIEDEETFKSLVAKSLVAKRWQFHACAQIHYIFSSPSAVLNREFDALVILINKDHDGGDVIEDCILSRLTYALGFVRITTVLGKNSIWSSYHIPTDPDSPGKLSYSPVEKMIIKAHFDPQLKHGMKRQDVLPIFRQIIIGLWPEFMGEPAPVN
jgi:hypothetical protein